MNEERRPTLCYDQNAKNYVTLNDGNEMIEQVNSKIWKPKKNVNILKKDCYFVKLHKNNWVYIRNRRFLKYVSTTNTASRGNTVYDKILQESITCSNRRN